MAFDIENFLNELHYDPRVAANELWSRFYKVFHNEFDDAFELSADSIIAYNLIIEFLNRANLNNRDLSKLDFDISSLPFNTMCSELGDYISRPIAGEVTSENAGALIEEQLNNYFGNRKYESGFAVLDSAEKLQIHGHLNKIREIIENSALGTRKKNRLFDKLAKLSREVDKEGTDTDAFFAFLGDAGFALGEMAENAQPFTKEVKDMMRIILRSREKQEGISLPPPSDNPLLPSSE